MKDDKFKFEEDIFINEDIYDSGVNEILYFIPLTEIKMIRFCASKDLREKISKSTKIYADNGGSFYKYKIDEKYSKNKIIIDRLKRYQISTDLSDSMYDVNCLVYALIQSGKFDEKTINSMKTTCYNRYISRKELDKFGKMFNINFKVVKYRKDQNKWDNITRNERKIIGNKDGILIELALIEKHYILNEIVEGISPFALQNYDEINQKCSNKTDEEKLKMTSKRNNGQFRTDARFSHINSYELVRLISQEKQEWTFEELCHLKHDLYKEVFDNIKNIEPNESKDFKPFQEPKLMSFSDIIYYADVECDISHLHEAYCISFMRSTDENPTFYFGRDCLYRFMDDLPDKSVVYFHNLGYDITAFHKFTRIKTIRKGRQYYSAEIIYKKKNIYFKDSYSLISMKLSMFPKMFNLKSGNKEMFPYKYYTFERFESNNNIGLIDEAGNEEISWDLDQFKENINSISNCKIDDNHFDMKKYAEFYCNQDVNILKQGFNKFREMCLELLKIDVNQTLTAASLANIYFARKVYSKVDDYYTYGGVVRQFISKAIYGGRCMMRDNKKWKVKANLCDLDAVSLYPSAMARLYLISGKPTIFNNSIDKQALLNDTCKADDQPTPTKPISAYIVEIEITKINKHRHFPLIIYKEKGLNKNDDNCSLPITMVVDNITLEDLIEFHDIEFNILRGCIWTGKKSFIIRDEIKYLFDLRNEFKKENNSMQQIVKLLMNSGYGKTIQKPIVETEKYLTNDRLIPYLIKNNSKIKEINQINENSHVARVGKSIDDFTSNTLLGVQILSMSKRIMNEVMCLAEDHDIKIFYQDTDSMHILQDQIPLLQSKFREKYNRELIGNMLGQFHNDFPLENGYAYQSIFLGKKCYCDLLKNDKGETAIHFRMKGIDLESVKIVANQRYKGESEEERIFNLFLDLLYKKPIEFELCLVKPRFTLTKQQRMKSISTFSRVVKFNGEVRYFSNVKTEN